MKISAVFLLLALQVSATNYAQERVNLKATNISIAEIFKAIESQSSYRFNYSNDILPTEKMISVNVVNADINTVLNKMFEGIAVRWKIEKKHNVFLTPVTVTNNAGAPPVTGVVRNEKGDPVEGASIIIKNSTIGTVTTSDGSFTLNVKQGDVLIISRVGYTTQEITVSDLNAITVTLTAVMGSMEEVVVVGYGTQRRVTVSGAANTVNTKLLTSRATSTITNSLQGTVPGLTILGRPGDVGNDIASVNIRGRGNLGTSAPLFVVDGVVVSAADFARLAPNDVENITILKDASAAIYGSRAAYGVVLVTTKKGKTGKMQVGYNFLYGNQRPTNVPKTLGSYDYATLYNEALTNAGLAKRFTDDELTKIKSGSDPDFYPNNNWYNLVYKKSTPLMQHDLTVSGGEKTKYYLGLSYMNQGSLIPNKDLNRYSLRANTNTKVGNVLDVGTNIFFVRDDIKDPNGTFSNVSLARMVPTMVAIQSDGNWGTMNGGRPDATLGKDNPLRTMKEGGRNSSGVNRLLTSLYATLRPFKGMTIDGQLSYNFTNSVTSAFQSTMLPLINFSTKKEILGSGLTTNSLKEDWSNYSVLSSQLYGSYEKNIQKHYFKVMAGTSYEGSKQKTISAGRKMFVSNDMNAIDGGSGTPENLSNAGGIQEKGFASYFSRLNYSFDNKYLLEGIFRADGTSQFPPDRRWGYYPGVSAAWIISNEEFMRSIPWLNNLKLRASYGELGNVNNVGNYDYFNLMATGTAAILDEGKIDGYWPNKLVSPTLTWEKVVSKNIGLDGTVLNGKLNFQIDVFDKLTKDILLITPQPFEFGLKEDKDVKKDQRPSLNAAKVSNKGFELTIGYNDRVGEIEYNIAGNVTKIWNKIIDLYGQPDQISSPWINRLGQAIGSFYGYKTSGLFKDTADVNSNKAAVPTSSFARVPGNVKYVDVNGDGKINADDRTIIGNDVPYFTYGLNGGLRYKGFDFSFIAQGVTNVKVYLSEEASQAFFNGAGVKEFHLGRWTTTNPDPNAIYPRVLLTANNSANQQLSDFWLFNASYFRIKNLTFGYTVPVALTTKYKVNQIRVFVTANNIFTIRGDKRLKDFDPEVPTSRASYPQLKTLSFGLNVNF